MRRDSSWRPEPAEAAAQAEDGHDDDAEAAAPEAGGRQTTDARIRTQQRPVDGSKDLPGLVGFGGRGNQIDV